jgi:tetratricopeptide (TPR) repeat protein
LIFYEKMMEVCMRFWIISLLLFAVNAASFAVSYDNLTPAQRKVLSSDWFEAGKAYYSGHKDAKAKSCFKFSNELYPMGPDAAQARDLLAKYYSMTVQYNPDSQFKAYVGIADMAQANKASTGMTNYMLNNLLMASEIKQDKDVLYRIALIYNSENDKTDAADYLNKALAAGYSPDSVDPELKGLLVK